MKFIDISNLQIESHEWNMHWEINSDSRKEKQKNMGQFFPSSHTDIYQKYYFVQSIKATPDGKLIKWNIIAKMMKNSTTEKTALTNGGTYCRLAQLINRKFNTDGFPLTHNRKRPSQSESIKDSVSSKLIRRWTSHPNCAVYLWIGQTYTEERERGHAPLKSNLPWMIR